MSMIIKPELNTGTWLDPRKHGVPKENGEYWCWDGIEIYKETFNINNYDWNEVYLYKKVEDERRINY